MRTRTVLLIGLTLACLFGMAQQAPAIPPITGTPTIDAPLLLDWPRDTDLGLPDLTEATANRLSDLHGQFTQCDFVLSTAGNYHMALREFWYNVFLPNYAAGLELKNWFFTTSPPVADQQIAKSNLVFGNLSLKCLPQVAVGPQNVITKLKALGYTEGEAVLVFRNRGNVLLVKKGNPKHVKDIWDLGRPDVHVVTPNPIVEKNTFDNYSGSIYNIAFNDADHVPQGWDADRLFNTVFNNKTIEDKWLIGARIHHREVPWSIAYGRADVGVLFYHLALDAVRTFPDLFEIMPLGGTEDDPQPLPGNRVGAHYAIRIKGNWSAVQLQAREKLMDAFASEEFTQILLRHGMQR